MATIKDIAKEAGVSCTTVSNVIHGNAGRVSPETVKRIRAIIKRTNYVPNMGARSLVNRSSRLIAFAYQMCCENDDRNIMQDPFISELVGALQQETRAAGYDMILSVLDRSGSLLESARRWNVDGIVVINADPDQSGILLEELDKPIAFIDSCFPENPRGRFVHVGVDDRAAAREMTRYLLAQGHRRIAFCSGGGWALDGPDFQRRLGYLDAMREASIAVPENWMETLGISSRERQAGLARIFQRRLEFSACFFTSDLYGAYMINYLQDRGVRVPQDLSIASFDGNFFSTTVRPMLTTMQQNPAEKARAAVRQLLRLIHGDAIAKQYICLPVHLITRDSVCRYNNSNM